MEPLELTIRIFVVLHLIGLGSLLGGFLTQLKSLKDGAKVVPAIMHGAWLLLVTGLAMIGMVYANGEKINHLTLGVKSAVITAIFFIAYSFNKKDKTPKWVVPTIGALTIVNIVMAAVVGMVVE
jgi:hypothetical protein